LVLWTGPEWALVAIASPVSTIGLETYARHGKCHDGLGTVLTRLYIIHVMLVRARLTV